MSRVSTSPPNSSWTKPAYSSSFRLSAAGTTSPGCRHSSSLWFDLQLHRGSRLLALVWAHLGDYRADCMTQASAEGPSALSFEAQVAAAARDVSDCAQ